MTDRIGLWWGTVEGATFSELVGAASASGFTDVSLTPAMYFAERRAGRSDADLRAELDAHGVVVAMIDPLIAGLPGIPRPDDVGPRFRSTFEHGETDCFGAADALGAGAIKIAHYLGAPTDTGALVDAIGAIAGRAAARGIDVLVEFMPEGSIPDLATAAAIVRSVSAPNCGLMFDTWHHWRGGGGVEEVQDLPSGSVRALQLSDALDDVRGSGTEPPTRDRLLPGEGTIPLIEIVRAARRCNADVAIGLEVFDRSSADLSHEERARRAKAWVDPLLAAVGEGPA
jgi:sugar phosphate isomerase/epimerase